jgi:hypothetical protein
LKKTAAIITALVLLATNVYAKDVWFIITPNVDNSGKLIKKADYEKVRKVETKFKIVEIIEEIIS